MRIDKDICRLCGKLKVLNLSHIVPAFVIKYLKKTSVTGYIRNSGQPNLTLQDGDKYPLFCGDCENKFSSDENYFASEIFFPYHNRILQPVIYDYRLARYCLLQAFRTIVYNEAILEDLSVYKPFLRKRLITARDFFREFLIFGAKTQNEYSNQLIFTNLIDADDIGSEIPTLPPDINMYLARSTDTAIVHTEKGNLFIYNKLCKIIILTFIRPKKAKDYKGTRIFSMGTLYPSGINITLPVSLLNFIISRALLIKSSKEKLSVKQEKLIIDRFLKNSEKIMDSECTEAHLADEKLQAAVGRVPNERSE